MIAKIAKESVFGDIDGYTFKLCIIPNDTIKMYYGDTLIAYIVERKDGIDVYYKVIPQKNVLTTEDWQYLNDNKYRRGHHIEDYLAGHYVSFLTAELEIRKLLPKYLKENI